MFAKKKLLNYTLANQSHSFPSFFFYDAFFSIVAVITELDFDATNIVSLSTLCWL
jgi:hypothetical protein